MEELLKFIGGFKYWPLLNEDCRMEVVKYLDYKERFKLGICSKSDYETVGKLPIHVESLGIRDSTRIHTWIQNEKFDNVVVRVKFHPDPNSEDLFEIVFSPIDNEHIRINWLQFFPNKKRRPIKKEVIWKSCNYYEEAVTFAEKWMKKCNYELRSLRVEMSKYPFETTQIKKFPFCNKEVKIGAVNDRTFDWWLQKIPEKIENLQLTRFSKEGENPIYTSEFLDKPQIIQATRLYFWCLGAFTDDQFLNLHAKSMNFPCDSITDNGINQFIKKWVHGRSVMDFQRVIIYTSRDKNPDLMIKGLEVQKWDDGFESVEKDFCQQFKMTCGSGNHYQIQSIVDPFQSLTLFAVSHRIGIYATGKRCEKDEKTFTRYTVPA